MGTEYEFEKDKKYNFDKNISMKLELNKTCFSKGEKIKASIFLLPKEDSFQTKLISPYIEIKLVEKHYYLYEKRISNNNRNINNQIHDTYVEEDNKIILSENLFLQNYKDLNISLNGLKIPFEIKIPQSAYPSCEFDTDAFVRHFLSINFPSIEAKKTLPIFIKNNIIFSIGNGRLKSPVFIQKEIKKNKYIFFDAGSFKFALTIPKNTFTYEEMVPFIIDIDCLNFSSNIKGIKVSIFRIYNLNDPQNHKIKRDRKKNELISKYISITKGEKIIHIEDYIKLPTSPAELNPHYIYSLLDNEMKNYKYKKIYENIKLFPCCYGGLLSCDYIIKFEFEIDSWFSEDEDLIIPLDFYEQFIESNDINETPKPIEIKGDEHELPNENEINQQQNEQKTIGDNNYQDGDAPPPSSAL